MHSCKWTRGTYLVHGHLLGGVGDGSTAVRHVGGLADLDLTGLLKQRRKSRVKGVGYELGLFE